MAPPDYAGYRFPSDVIQRAVWMYLRFTLSYRDVEDLLTERGIEVSYETIRRWGACHVVERGRDEAGIRQAQAATPAASRHAANASARKRRCVRAVVR